MTKTSATILSFSKAKKTKTRQVKEQTAKENRVLYGQTKAQKKLSKAKIKKENETLDGSKITSLAKDHPKEDPKE